MLITRNFQPLNPNLILIFLSNIQYETFASGKFRWFCFVKLIEVNYATKQTTADFGNR